MSVLHAFLCFYYFTLLLIYHFFVVLGCVGIDGEDGGSPARHDSSTVV